MSATVHLDTEHHVGDIDPRIFGGFLEHLGRAVYGGVYDPGNPLSDENGFRRDVIDALRPLAMPVMRYPGGNFVSNYDWRDGVGPREQRPTRPDHAWKTLDTNHFGTDEFIAWCRQLATEPMLAVNLGNGTPQLAADLVDYCNTSGGTIWSDQRRRNGHSKPYGVRLWCLGNEMDGHWQVGHCSAGEYARRALAAAILMRERDPVIETVLCGSCSNALPTYLHWDREVLETAWDEVQYISAHRYSENKADDTPGFLAEGVEIDRVLDEYSAAINFVRGLKKSRRRVGICFDEWNVWYRARHAEHVDGKWQKAPPLLEEQYNLEDALVAAQYLASFIRHADVVKIACIAQIVNVIAPILARPDGLLIQTIYWPFLLFRRHATGRSLTPVINCPTYTAGAQGEAPQLDVAASYDEATQQASVFLINRSPSHPLPVTIHVADHRIRGVAGVDLLSGTDPKAANTWENPDRIRPIPGQATADESGDAILTLPPLALAVLRLHIEPRQGTRLQPSNPRSRR